mgnify:CR=1 FL=1
MLVFQLLILYKVQISRVLAFYFGLSISRHSHLSQWFLMRTACPSLCKSLPITSNHPQSPPITPNHPPITSKLADQSPSNHLSCFIHNDARSDFSNRRRSVFNDQSMWESSYFFTWGAAITMMMRNDDNDNGSDGGWLILPCVCDVCLQFCWVSVGARKRNCHYHLFIQTRPATIMMMIRMIAMVAVTVSGMVDLRVIPPTVCDMCLHSWWVSVGVAITISSIKQGLR